MVQRFLFLGRTHFYHWFPWLLGPKLSLRLFWYLPNNAFDIWRAHHCLFLFNFHSSPSVDNFWKIMDPGIPFLSFCKSWSWYRCRSSFATAGTGKDRNIPGVISLLLLRAWRFTSFSNICITTFISLRFIISSAVSIFISGEVVL